MSYNPDDFESRMSRIDTSNMSNRQRSLTETMQRNIINQRRKSARNIQRIVRGYLTRNNINDREFENKLMTYIMAASRDSNIDEYSPILNSDLLDIIHDEGVSRSRRVNKKSKRKPKKSRKSRKSKKSKKSRK